LAGFEADRFDAGLGESFATFDAGGAGRFAAVGPRREGALATDRFDVARAGSEATGRRASALSSFVRVATTRFGAIARKLSSIQARTSATGGLTSGANCAETHPLLPRP
jgi:hypothetical protein